MVNLEDDEYETLCVALSTYRKLVASLEVQNSKLKEIIKHYDPKFDDFCKTNQKPEEITSESNNGVIMKTLDEAIRSDKK